MSRKSDYMRSLRALREGLDGANSAARAAWKSFLESLPKPYVDDEGTYHASGLARLDGMFSAADISGLPIVTFKDMVNIYVGNLEEPRVFIIESHMDLSGDGLELTGRIDAIGNRHIFNKFTARDWNAHGNYSTGTVVFEEKGRKYALYSKNDQRSWKRQGVEYDDMTHSVCLEGLEALDMPDRDTVRVRRLPDRSMLKLRYDVHSRHKEGMMLGVSAWRITAEFPEDRDDPVFARFSGNIRNEGERGHSEMAIRHATENLAPDIEEFLDPLKRAASILK